jgi:dethiobiotin synthetase
MLDAVSPHIAAKRTGIRIEIPRIARYAAKLSTGRDLLLIEGAGGWLAPISETETMADVALALGYPVLLVVGMRLGCLNHALLTAQAIRTTGCTLAGWIGSHVDPDFGAPQENLETLTQRLGAPPLAVLEHEPTGAGDPRQLQGVIAALLERRAPEVQRD